MDKVIELFKSGNATEDQWEELATAVLFASEVKVLMHESDPLLWSIDELVEFDENEEENNCEANH
jgi:hypothetical protein